MIEVGSFLAGTRPAVTRRAFVRASFAAGLLAQPALRALAADNGAAPKGRSVILLWLWGGPSHLDTFDPKPHAPLEIRGPFSAVATRTPGLIFSELFPLLAQRSHLFSVVRSNRNLTNVHHFAGGVALTGANDNPGDGDYPPNLGSVVQKAFPERKQLPPFIAVPQRVLDTAIGGVKAIGGGPWGKAYDPFPVSCTERGEVRLEQLQLLDGLAPDRLNDRRRLLDELAAIQRAGESPSFENWDANFQRAYSLLTSPEGRRAFDLGSEPDATKSAYGRTIFGQSCLLARRLVEAGVPYIQVNWSKWVESVYGNVADFGWDTHRLNFEFLADYHGPILDRAVSAQMDDLHQRGLLENTLVVALGEFGRTPKISSDGGRDHWPNVYCSLWAGAGIQPGRVIGQSDDRGHEPVTEPVLPSSVGVTILSQMGLTTERLAELRVLPNAHVIEALL